MIEIEVVRGQFVESRHSVAAVVVDENGKTVKSFGDPDLVTSPRSAIKMLQALPLVASGAADRYKLNSHHLCLACASHNGEDGHIHLAEKWMELIGADETWFRCGAHWPSHESAMHKWV